MVEVRQLAAGPFDRHGRTSDFLPDPNDPQPVPFVALTPSEQTEIDQLWLSTLEDVAMSVAGSTDITVHEWFYREFATGGVEAFEAARIRAGIQAKLVREIPEPGTLTMLGFMLAVLVAARRRRAG